MKRWILLTAIAGLFVLGGCKALENSGEWLSTPNPNFDNTAPIDALVKNIPRAVALDPQALLEVGLVVSGAIVALFGAHKGVSVVAEKKAKKAAKTALEVAKELRAG